MNKIETSSPSILMALADRLMFLVTSTLAVTFLVLAGILAVGVLSIG